MVYSKSPFCWGRTSSITSYAHLRHHERTDKVIQVLKNDGSMTGIIRGARTSNTRCNHSMSINVFFIHSY